MRNKPSFTSSLLVPAGRIRATVLAAAAFLCAPAAMAGSPDWLRALIGQPVPQCPENTNAVVMWDERLTTVDPHGEIKTLYRRAYRILRPEGRRYATLVVYFDDETRLTYLKAWSIPAQGKEYEVKEKDATETSPFSEGLYVDTRLKVLNIPSAEPGSLIGYEYEQRRHPSILQDVWWFQHEIPVRHTRFTLRLPSDWEYESRSVNHPPVQPRRSAGNQWTWELENVPAVEPEPSMPPWRSLAGRLAVTFFPAHPDLQSKTVRSWQEVGHWYAELSTSSRQATPQIRKKVAELTASTPAQLDKLRALAGFVQRDVRYVAVEIGIGGYQPHPAETVLANLYGDCKDKATLLGAMLREIGIDSYYVLTNIDRGVVVPEFPSMLDFNHVILAIRLPRETADSGLYALFDHPTFGTLLFFDPTETSIPLGYLPSTEQANRGLLVTENGGQLVELPLLPPAANHLVRSARLALDSSGVLSGEIEEIRSGSAGAEYRTALLRASVSERRKVLEKFLGSFLNGFQLNHVEVENLRDFDKELILRYRFTADQYGKKAGNLLLFRPAVVGESSMDLLESERRTQPIEFSELFLGTENFELALPLGFQPDGLPAPFHADLPFAEYQSRVEIEDHKLRYSRTYQVKRLRIPVENLAELKIFFRQVAADEREMVVLKRSEN